MKNKLKKLTPLLLVMLLVIGASAWLTNKKEATSINKISPGTFSVVFSNDEKEVKIENAIPMTMQYAKANLEPYTFTVENNSDMAVDYVISIDEEKSIFNGFTKDEIMVAYIVDDNLSGASTRHFEHWNSLDAHVSRDYTIWFYVKESVTNVENKSATIQLKLNAVQQGEIGEVWSVQMVYNDEFLIINNNETTFSPTSQETYEQHIEARKYLTIPPADYLKTVNTNITFPESYDYKFYKVDGDTKTDITEKVDYSSFLAGTGSPTMKDYTDFSGQYVIEIVAK